MKSFNKPLILNRKAQVASFQSLISILLLIGVAAVVAVILAETVQDLRSDQTANTSAYNTSTNALSYFDNVSGQWALLGTVIGLILVVSVVIAAFRFGRGAGGI